MTRDHPQTGQTAQHGKSPGASGTTRDAGRRDVHAEWTFSRVDALLMASNGKETSISFLRDVSILGISLFRANFVRPERRQPLVAHH